MMVDKSSADNVFSGLYVSYYARLVRFASLYVGSVGDAENIVQDLFLHLWEQREILPELQRPDAFLFTSVKRRCLNHLRSQLNAGDRHRALSEVVEQELKFNLYSLQLLDETELSIEEIETTLQKAIDSLPGRCREIFIMSKLRGMKYKEIAGELQLSVNTVENQMAIALKKLREELRDCLPLFLLFV